MTVTWNCPTSAQYADEEARLVGQPVPQAVVTTPTVWDKVAIYDMIMESDRALYRGITAIYERQTESEKSIYATTDDNGVGFSAFDAEFLSSLAVGIKQYGALTVKQKASGRKAMKKYCNQLAKIANGEIA